MSNVNNVKCQQCQICPDLSRYAQICQDMPRFVEICPDMLRSPQIWRDPTRSIKILRNLSDNVKIVVGFGFAISLFGKKEPLYWRCHESWVRRYRFQSQKWLLNEITFLKMLITFAWMGGGLTPTWIFLDDLSTSTEGPQRWSFITKKWYFLTKVFLIPQNRSF